MTEPIHFNGALGEQLAARLDMPEQSPIAYVLFAHCFTCSKDLSAITRISRALTSDGFALFRFDFTGLGMSQGEFANTNFSSNVQDLVAAGNFLREHYKAPSILIGHSFGGTAVLAAAKDIPEVKAVATIGAPFEPGHVAHFFSDDQLKKMKEQGILEVAIEGRPFTIKQQFVDDINGHNMEAHISNLHRALLIFHAPRDQTVGIENAELIYKAAKHPKSFISLDDADHMLRQKGDGQYVAKVLAAWASRYIDGVEEASNDTS